MASAARSVAAAGSLTASDTQMTVMEKSHGTLITTSGRVTSGMARTSGTRETSGVDRNGMARSGTRLVRATKRSGIMQGRRDREAL